MSIDTIDTTKSTQEQAIAAWIGYLNQLRIDGLLATLKAQNTNLEQALRTLKDTAEQIDIEIVTRNRGGTKGMHGFIAEVAEVGINNARREIIGEDANMSWVNDNGKVDLIRDGIDIQQKFVNAGGRFSLGAVAKHLHAYPDFVQNGGKYQIPSDHYDNVKRLLTMSKEEAARLSKTSDSLSIRDWDNDDADTIALTLPYRVWQCIRRIERHIDNPRLLLKRRKRKTNPPVDPILGHEGTETLRTKVHLSLHFHGEYFTCVIIYKVHLS